MYSCDITLFTTIRKSVMGILSLVKSITELCPPYTHPSIDKLTKVVIGLDEHLP